MLSEHESHDSGSFTQLCLSNLGVYEVSTYHGHKGLNVLRKFPNMWDFSRSRRNDFETGGFSVHTKTIKQCKQMSEDKLFFVLYYTCQVLFFIANDYFQYLGLPLVMRIKAQITIQAMAMHTPTIIPVIDLWSMW